MVVFQDISIIKQEESRLRSIIENVLTGIVMVNEEGRITQVNRQAEVIFGYTHEELCGQEVEVLVPEPLRRVHRQHMEGYLRDPEPREMAGSLDLVGLRKDGQMVALQVLLNPIWLEGHRFVLASVLDITEKKRAADLIESVVEFSPDSTIMVDHKGRIVHGEPGDGAALRLSASGANRPVPGCSGTRAISRPSPWAGPGIHRGATAAVHERRTRSQCPTEGWQRVPRRHLTSLVTS